MDQGWTRGNFAMFAVVLMLFAAVIALTQYRSQVAAAGAVAEDTYDAVNPAPLLYFDLSKMDMPEGYRDSLLAIQRDGRILRMELDQVWVEGRIELVSGDTLLLKDYQGGRTADLPETTTEGGG